MISSHDLQVLQWDFQSQWDFEMISRCDFQMILPVLQKNCTVSNAIKW